MPQLLTALHPLAFGAPSAGLRVIGGDPDDNNLRFASDTTQADIDPPFLQLNHVRLMGYFNVYCWPTGPDGIVIANRINESLGTQRVLRVLAAMLS